MLLADGNVYTFGKKGMGRSNYLGHGDNKAQVQPKAIEALSGQFVTR